MSLNTKQYNMLICGVACVVLWISIIIADLLLNTITIERYVGWITILIMMIFTFGIIIVGYDK